jgi:hypothetical protein
MDDVIERIEGHNGHIFYRIHSEYAKSTLAIEPTQLYDLLVYLNDNENLILRDAQTNRQREQKQQGDNAALDEE